MKVVGYRIGQESLIEEDYSEEDVEDELAPISVQLAYLQQVTVFIACSASLASRL